MANDLSELTTGECVGNDPKFVKERVMTLMAEYTAKVMAIAAGGAMTAWEPDWRPLKAMMKLTGRSDETLISGAKRHGVGIKRDGRWYFDLNRWNAYVEGRPYPRLPTSGG